MARLFPLGRLSRRPAPAETPLADRVPQRPAVLRRERRALMRVREERVRDLGGLVLEMHRRDRFRPDLLEARCAELAGIDERLAEVEALLAAARRTGRPGQPQRCDCGAPMVWGSHFCANCGRPVGARPVVACAYCGSPLPADARFCSSCGRAATDPVPYGIENASPREPGDGAG